MVCILTSLKLNFIKSSQNFQHFIYPRQNMQKFRYPFACEYRTFIVWPHFIPSIHGLRNFRSRKYLRNSHCCGVSIQSMSAIVNGMVSTLDSAVFIIKSLSNFPHLRKTFCIPRNFFKFTISRQIYSSMYLMSIVCVWCCEF
jgi:hypothetical protein